MRNIMVIIKKELRRFFTDKRMLMSLILPGVMIFVLYSLMGNFMSKSFTIDEEYVYEIVVINNDKDLFDREEFAFLNTDLFNLTLKDNSEIDSIKQTLRDKELDLLIVLEDDFFNKVNQNNLETLPLVEIFYNETKIESSQAYGIFYESFTKFEKNLLGSRLEINPADTGYDLSTTESQTIMIVVMIVPFLLITFLFTGAMSISIESIAGEKERGTIATLLATPVKRFEISTGKIISLSIISLVSTASSFLGLMLSLPKMMAGADVDMSIYSVGTYILLFVVLITTTLLFVVIISIISAYAKSIKEATSLSSVLMIVNMLVGITSITGLTTTKTSLFFVPIYNSVQSISSILAQDFNALNFGVTIISNTVLVGLGIFILTKMFNSEKIMFNK